MARFSIACSEKVRKEGSDEKQQRTEWVPVICWDKMAEIAQQYLRKGIQVYVRGKFRTRSYEGNDGVKRYATEIYASDLKMLGKKREKVPMPSSPDIPPASVPQEMQAPDDDLTF